MKAIHMFVMGAFCVLIVSAGLLSCAPAAMQPEASSEELSFSVDSGLFEEEVFVAISSSLEGAEIRYTLDGSDPDADSELYIGPVEIPAYGEEVSLKAAVIQGDSRGSKVCEKKYTVKCKEKVATPKLSPEKGIFDAPIEVKISIKTENAKIYYTTDGTKPDENDTLYTAPIKLEAGTTVLKAFAAKPGLKDSSCVSGMYVVLAKPHVKGEILFSTNRDFMEFPPVPDIELPEDGAFVRELYSMKATGEDPTRLTTAVFDDTFFEFWDFPGGSNWSPDRKKIVFVYITNINPNQETLFVMNADGSGRDDLYSALEGRIGKPSWSPDGKKIAFTVEIQGPTQETNGLYIIKPDGTGLAAVIESEEVVFSSPSFSPDSGKIAFIADGRIKIINVDGTGLKTITGPNVEKADVDWHPYLSKLVFSFYKNGNWEIYSMNVDGSHLRRLTDEAKDDRYPDWSPDGKKIAFATDRTGNWEVFRMSAYGTNLDNLTENPAEDTKPAW